MAPEKISPGFLDMLDFGLLEALLGRRSRRFFRGAEIPDGVFAHKSTFPVQPLSELETLLVVAACGANTAWHHLIQRAERYAPHLSNYAGAAGGRTFPSAAGFHTSRTFFTDDRGVFLLEAQDSPAWEERRPDGSLDLDGLLDKLRSSIKKLQDGRLKVPPRVPWVEPHNTWVVNRPGTLLVIPVADLAQHMILNLCYMLQNGLVLFDDINRRPIPGIEEFADLAGPGDVWPLTFVEQIALAEVTVELATSCYAGALMLQAMGLGGWTFNGVSPHAILGADGDPAVTGLGFRYDTREDWALPNVTGLPGVMEGHCPPHFPDMAAAVESVCRRKFGPGGPFNPGTPGPWKDSPGVRGAAQPHSQRFSACITLQAQYLLDTFGKFPATIPSIFTMQYLQAMHLDLEFYDRFYRPGAYLQTHARHQERWHPGE